MIEEKGGDDYIFLQIADSVPMRKIVSEFINPESGEPFNRAMLYYWRNLKEERKAAWKEARKIAAHNTIDDALEEMEELDSRGLLSPADVSLLNSKIKFRQYLAERWNREEYGTPEPQAQVAVNFGGDFLAALRQYGNAHNLPAGARAALADPDIIEAEIVEDEPADDDLSDLLDP